MQLEIRVPAKINLWLEILGKRSDGYHDLSSLMLPIGVYDRMELTRLDEEVIRLDCTDPQVPSDAGNLVWKAAKRFMEAAGFGGGVQIHLEKHIPSGAGLGGGSSDAAGTLLALNRLFDAPLSPGRLHDVASLLGADVPFFLYCSPAVATGIGEILEPVEGVPDYPLVLVKPPLSVSTGWVYRSLTLTRGESRIKLRSFQANPWRLGEFLQNDLETVTLEAYPLLKQIKRWLMDQGALGALMSGSGPTVFGVFPDGERAARVAAFARDAWKECWVAAANVIGHPADAGRA